MVSVDPSLTDELFLLWYIAYLSFTWDVHSFGQCFFRLTVTHTNPRRPFSWKPVETSSRSRSPSSRRDVLYRGLLVCDPVVIPAAAQPGRLDIELPTPDAPRERQRWLVLWAAHSRSSRRAGRSGVCGAG